MKKCPFCAEEIQDAATKCRYCRRLLDEHAAIAASAGQRDEFEDVRELARQGKKLDAIKLLREKTGWELKEANDFVENPAFGIATALNTTTSNAGADAEQVAAKWASVPKASGVRPTITIPDSVLAATARGQSASPKAHRDRSQTIELITTAAPSDAFQALVSSLGPAKLTLLSRDDGRLSLSAEHPWSLFNNSWGEDVTAQVVPTDTGSVVRITCAAKSRIGGLKPERHFRNLQTQLRERLGSAEVSQSIGVGSRYSARTRWSAQTEKLDGELARAIGANGVVVLFSDKVAILRIRRVLTALNQGMKGDKEIRLSRITSIQLRKPSGVTRGYIQFELMGGNSSQAGLLAAVKDENTVLFDPAALPSFLSIKDQIEEQLSASEKARSLGHLDPATNSPTQQLKEWKELLDLGAITPAEYEAKKVEILRHS